MGQLNKAAWIREPKGKLTVEDAPYPVPTEDEIIVKNEAFAIQPFDAGVRALAYIELPYPFILGNGVAGIVEETGQGVSKFKKDDRVIIDTPSYNAKESKYGGWQRYVVGKQATAAKIADRTSFEDAAAIPYALLTAVAGLQLKLGMEKPGANKNGKVLIWGAGGAVGGYAVQYAKSVGYDVIATASPRKFDYVRGLGASEVLDYKNDQVVTQLKALGPFDFIMSASGDPVSANAISDILQPNGGRFVMTRPKNDQMHVAENVEYIYDFLSMVTQKPENSAFSKWWYDEYLPTALGGKVVPTPFEKRVGGLGGIQGACDDIVAGKHSKKLLLSPNDS